MNEAMHLKRIAHPNILRIRGVASHEEESTKFFIVLDRLYFTLEQQTDKWRKQADNRASSWKNCSSGRQIWSEKINVGYDIAGAMNYLHKKRIIYRDLKPQNIGFDVQGKVKLFDFDLAKELPSTDKGEYFNMTGLTGSIRYMSPEVFNEKLYNLSADVYSFGILFWQICSTQIPFFRMTIKTIHDQVANGSCRPHIPFGWDKQLRQLMKRCWNSHPSLRPSFFNVLEILGEVRENH
uniref:Protein kinase domain-containing protein n=2 Tax=Corethron hystrix TaxID=216773 RepID=A0A7S1FLK5_9STRA|mmetsp:Transcript_14147/g.30935  ORF Transcript_14147/g.30935 Transcript_14147/m.30935 type:complete len:237 (+) Transcript_14147:483-1193(+)